MKIIMSDPKLKMFYWSDLLNIDIEGSPKVRNGIRQEVVSEYAEQYRNKAKMPPPLLCEIAPNKYLIADGLHRITAMKSFPDSAKGFWAVHLFKGDYVTCLKEALLANLSHGLRRSNADKRAGAMAALKQFPGMSNGHIAEMCAVGDELVRDVRKELEGRLVVPVSTVRTGTDGRARNLPKREVEAPKNNQNKEDSNNETVSPRVNPKSEPAAKREPLRCEMGVVIPIKLEPLWNRRDEVKALLKKISQVKCSVEDALAKDDPLYREMNNSFLADAKTLYETLTYAIPYTVCTKCNGQLTKDCGFCRGSGFLSKQKYLLAPKEVRDMREKMNKK